MTTLRAQRIQALSRRAPEPVLRLIPEPLKRPDGTPLRALVVDEQPRLAAEVVQALREDGWEAWSALSGNTAVRLAHEHQPDLVILDVALPDANGIEVMRELRRESEEVGVVFTSAHSTVQDRIAGIRAGADDYLGKPFSLQELLVRSRGLARRAGFARSHAPKALCVGDLVIDEEAHEVTRGGERITLTSTEFNLLATLARNPRRVMSKRQLLDEVWHYDFGGRAHVVELYISYLRKKVDSGRPPMIHTVRGVGYLLKPA